MTRNIEQDGYLALSDVKCLEDWYSLSVHKKFSYILEKLGMIEGDNSFCTDNVQPIIEKMIGNGFGYSCDYNFFKENFTDNRWSVQFYPLLHLQESGHVDNFHHLNAKIIIHKIYKVCLPSAVDSRGRPNMDVIREMYGKE